MKRSRKTYFYAKESTRKPLGAVRISEKNFKRKVDASKIAIGLSISIVFMLGFYFVLKNYLSNPGIGHIMFGVCLTFLFLKEMTSGIHSVFEGLDI